MASKLIIHPGFHKTGTTAIQASLTTKRAELLAKGILYPWPGLSAHHRAAWALSGRSWGWKNRGGTTTDIERWNSIAKEYVNHKGVAILSSEFLTELSVELLEKIKKDTQAKGSEKTDIQVVFTLRPLAKLLASTYQQYLKVGIKSNYETWLHSIFDDGAKGKHFQNFWRRNRHAEVMARWAQVFGPENVTVIVVDETKPDFLYESFNNLLGLEKDFLVASEDRGINRSLTFPEISLLLKINQEYPLTREWQDYLAFIRSGAIKHLTDKVPANPEDQKLLTPEWAVTKAKEITAESIQQIKDLGINVVGPLDEMVNATVPTGSNEPVDSISLESAAEMLISFDQKSVAKRLTTLVLFNELRSRQGFLVKKGLGLLARLTKINRQISRDLGDLVSP